MTAARKPALDGVPRFQSVCSWFKRIVARLRPNANKPAPVSDRGSDPATIPPRHAMPALNKISFDRLDLAALMAGTEPRCSRMAGALDAKARELQASGNHDGAAMLALLAEVCSYGLRPDDGREPYGPRARGPNWRTASIEDLDDTQLAFLAEIYEAVPIADLRARVADVLFVRRRHHKFGQCAIDSYLTSADTLMKPDDWVEALHLLERGLMITLSVKSERDRLVAKLTTEINNRRVDNSYFSAKVMQALLDRRLGDDAAMAPIAEDSAKVAIAAKDWDRAREYFGSMAQWRRRSDDATGELHARREAANCYIEQASGAGSRSLESTFLERAIQSLRAIPGTQADVTKLHERLIDVEREALKELKEHSTPIKLGENPERARAHVAGQTLQQAVVRTALLWRPDPIGKIRDVVLETAKQAVMFSAIPRVMMNRHGKAVAKRGSLLVGADEDREHVLRCMMFERAQQQRDYVTVSTILPARTQVADEHYVSARELMPFTTASGFVPLGREEPFAVGLAAGFNGDFAGALHILMPQFENAVRAILAQSGTITSKIDDDGIQDERDLGWLLTCDDAAKVFGEDLVFDMRGLLIERWGSNLRNMMAHGLIEVDQMVGSASAYFWWLTWHLVVRPLVSPAAPKPDPASSAGDPGNAAPSG